MSDQGKFNITAAHAEVVRAAARSAFGHARIDDIDLMSGGVSGAFPFRVRLGDRSYLVRLEGRASPLRNPFQYEAMRIASDQGIAPRVHHIDETARVAVMDFIEERPLAEHPGGRRGLVEAAGEMLARVRAAPSFPRFVDYPDIVGRLWAWVCRTGLFAPGLLDPFTRRFAEIAGEHGRDPTCSCSSHNDPIPSNVLFDGSRLWLVDWESAYLNDPLVDTAILMDNLAGSPELERALLEASWDGAIHGSFLERLDRVRALCRLYYAGVLLSASHAGQGALADADLEAPTIEGLRAMVRDGHLVPGTPMMAHVLGKMYLGAFIADAVPPPLDMRLILA